MIHVNPNIIVIDFAGLLDSVTWRRILSLCCFENIRFILDVNTHIDVFDEIFHSDKFHIEEVRPPSFNVLASHFDWTSEDKYIYEENRSVYKTQQTRVFRSLTDHGL